MTTSETTPHRPPFMAQLLYYGSYAVFTVIIGGAIWLNWPMIVASYQARTTTQPQSAQTSPAPATAPRLVVPPYQPAAAPQAPVQAAPTTSLAQVEATSLVIYHATAQAAEPQPNVDALPAGAPAVEYGSRANDIAPAGPDVATAEPLPVTGDQFGSKQAPVDIQGTHTCLHGQVWTATGCHRPTPVR